MAKKILSIIFVVLLAVANICAQKQNTNWYFGENIGLDFNTNPISILNEGKTANAYGHTASVSDANGQLLFYTDGNSVWNKNHIKMTNGDNTILSEGGTVVISPFPGNDKKYYIFTRRNFFKYNSIDNTKYYYSIVNLNTERGAVESINTDLKVLPYFSPEEGFTRSGAQRDHMVMTKHSDGESYWLIINPFDYFFAIKISSSGIDSPVISKADGGYFRGRHLETRNHGSSGMSISSNGGTIAYLNNFNIEGSSGGGVSLLCYSFNNLTGSISLNFSKELVNAIKGYSVEFSPDNNKLYALTYDGRANLLQFNINNIGSKPEVISSNFLEDLNLGLNTMRLAQDGKIYVPFFNNSKLSVINTPNGIGNASNFVSNQVDLGGREATLLPQLVPFHGPICRSELVITQNVNVNQVDNQSAQNNITATNTVNNGAIANYDAGISVVLKPGFKTKTGAKFKAFIEGCSVVANKVRANLKKVVLENKNTLIKLYPNPTKDIFKIESNSNIAKYIILNQLGKIVLSNTINKSFTSVNIQNLTSGIYFAQITLQNGEIVTKKIIKK